VAGYDSEGKMTSSEDLRVQFAWNVFVNIIDLVISLRFHKIHWFS